jgi:hypothetical protein
LAAEEVCQRDVDDAVPLKLGHVALDRVGRGPEVNPALEAMDHGDGPGGEYAIQRIDVSDHRHHRVVPLGEVALHLLELRFQFHEVAVVWR